jgi:hypothetical protein
MNIIQAKDAVLLGNLKYERWRARFEMEWNAPLLVLQEKQMVEKMLALWEQMPLEQKQRMRAVNPQMYAELEQRMKELGNEKGNLYPAAGRNVISKGG